MFEPFNISEICDELDRQYRHARRNGLSRLLAIAHASESVHDKLSRITVRWSDGMLDKSDEERKK